MKTIYIIILILISIHANSQCFFHKIYDTFPGALNAGFGVTQTLDGGFIAIGTSHITQTTDGTYILRVNVCGDTLWQKIYEFSLGNGGEEGRSVIQLLDNTYIICGWALDSIEQARSTFLLKINLFGEIIWFKPINAGYNDLAVIHKQTSDSGFIIGGYFNAVEGKVFLIKTDNMGNVEWQREYGALNQNNYVKSIGITPDGNYFIGGETYNPQTGVTVMYLIKTDSAGNQKWRKTYSTNTYTGYAIATIDKGFIIAGAKEISPNIADGYIIKTDSNGVAQWTKTIGESGITDYFHNIRQLPDGSYIVGGTKPDYSGTPNGAKAWLQKLNQQGDTVWSKTYNYYGGSKHTYLNDLNLTSDGGFICTGYIINNQMPGQNDLWLLKTDSLGNICAIDTNTWQGCQYQECSYTQATFTVSSDTIDLQFTDTIHFYDQSTFAQHWFWNFDDGTTDTVQNPLHVFDTTGTFQIMLVASLNDCSDTVYRNVVVVNSTGIAKDKNQMSNVRIVPNPAKEKIFVFSSEPQAELAVYDIHGLCVLQRSIAKETEIDVSGWHSGVYFVKVTTEKGIFVRKLVVE